MATTIESKCKSQTEKNQDESVEIDISSLPKEKGWFLENVLKYEGFWFEEYDLVDMYRAKQTFKHQPNDVMLATFPKSGTTWFSALLFTTMSRARYCDYSAHPLLENSPHDCSRWMEFPGKNTTTAPADADMSGSSPVVKTHFPFTLLPQSVTTTCECRIVCRNPADMFVSLWFFANKLRPEELPSLVLDEAFDQYCQGVCPFGSYWDHVLRYWNTSKERPNQVLFLRYEDMQSQPITILYKLAEFVGCPFTKEEEQDGVIAKIVEICSFESLTGLKVNQDSTERRDVFNGFSVPNDSFFRKGKVGDYENMLTVEMVQRLKIITSAKFKDSGLDVFAQII